MYVVCVILRNALTCMYTNSTSEYFLPGPSNLWRLFFLNIHLYWNICKT